VALGSPEATSIVERIAADAASGRAPWLGNVRPPETGRRR
jgi:hypothetical protein